VLETIPAQDGADVFELESRDGKVVVRGNDGVAIASGLNWYLKHYGHCHVSFCGDQLNLADPLPAVPQKVRRVSPHKYRYCFNYCAFSYTLAFWDWPQWERMIDWMALHGINMPLAVTGQEATWQKVYRDLGLTDEQIRAFLVGPAYLPFGWMGCIDGWGGPLPQSWIDRHFELQKKVLARQREFGMTPVLQGFTGHVPTALKQVFPQAKFRQLPSWCGFPGTHFVDPADPLFERVGKAFIEEQTRQFGTDHLYGSDTFIEMSPPSNDPKFLDEMGKAVYRAMAAGDPQAVWIMQGWLFFHNPKFWMPPQTKALLGSVPDDRMIVLDLFCESAPVWDKTEAFCGKPWVWCIIQSFGAHVSLHAGLPQIAKNLHAAISSPKRGKLSGVGLIMEGFGYNPVVFDLVTEMAWHKDVPELDGWLRDFVLSRYGRRSAAADEAWQTLRGTVYSTPGQAGSLLCARPSLGLGGKRDFESAAKAWRQLLQAADELGAIDTYQYDLVHVARHALTCLAPRLYDDVLAAYKAKDRPALAKAAARLRELIADQDEMLSTRREFLLGRWLEDAKRWAANDDERRLYEWNARNLITLWGPRDSILHEYSQREWSGMMRGFYLPRWEMFLAALDRSLADGKPADTAKIESRLRDWEVQWTQGSESYPAAPRGNPVAVSRKLWAKYGKRP
jgi:alpha-N-acetylglucosaminidase